MLCLERIILMLSVCVVVECYFSGHIIMARYIRLRCVIPVNGELERNVYSYLSGSFCKASVFLRSNSFSRLYRISIRI